MVGKSHTKPDINRIPLIMERPENGWENVNISNILTAGPLLIFENPATPKVEV